MNESPALIKRNWLRLATWYTLPIFIARGLSLVLLPVWTYFLTPHDYGLVGLTEVVGAGVMSFAGFGFPAVLIKRYFEHDHDSDRHKQVVASIFFGGCLAITLLAIFAIGLTTLGISWRSIPPIPHLAAAIIIGAELQLLSLAQSFFQANGDGRGHAFCEMVYSICGLSFALLFVAGFGMNSGGLLCGKALGGTVGIFWIIQRLRRSRLPDIRFANSADFRQAMSIGIPYCHIPSWHWAFCGGPHFA